MTTMTHLMKVAADEVRRTGMPEDTVLKEILQYDILAAITESGLGGRVAFQGGSCLRKVYGSERYSEDLDFALMSDDAVDHLEGVCTSISKRLAERYGLQVRFKHKQMTIGGREVFGEEAKTVGVSRLQAVVSIPRSDKSLKQNQMIKVEVAAVPAYDTTVLPVRSQYDEMLPGSNDILIRASSLKEIMADKILAIASRKDIKARDIWDVRWMMSRTVEIDFDLIEKKLADYGEAGVFEAGMIDRIDRMRDPEYHKVWKSEIERFLPALVARQLSASPEVASSMVLSVAKHMEQVLEARRRGEVVLSVTHPHPQHS